VRRSGTPGAGSGGCRTAPAGGGTRSGVSIGEGAPGRRTRVEGASRSVRPATREHSVPVGVAGTVSCGVRAGDRARAIAHVSAAHVSTESAVASGGSSGPAGAPRLRLPVGSGAHGRWNRIAGSRGGGGGSRRR